LHAGDSNGSYKNTLVSEDDHVNVNVLFRKTPKSWKEEERE